MIHLHLKVASETHISAEALTVLSDTTSESTLPSSANLHLHFPANREMNITFDNPTNKAPSIVPAATAQDQTNEEKGADQSERELKDGYQEDAEDRDGIMKKKEGEEGGLQRRVSSAPAPELPPAFQRSADVVERIASFSTALREATLSTMQLLAEMYVLYKVDSDTFTCTVTGCRKIYGSPDAAILHVQMAHAPILAEVVEKEFHAAVQRVCTEPPYTSN
ncbi:hypothetical protein CF326_g1236 [Tilletia indica]|nr:hypothetical protein CF326_g1236 [Tilletia indica]